MKRTTSLRLNSRVHPHAPSRWLARFASGTGLAVAGLALSLAAHAQTGAQVIEGIFTDAKSSPDWTASGTALRDGSARNPTTDGTGWLTLIPANKDFTIAQVQANSKLASGVPVRLSFDYLSWGGHAADGLSIYFADANAPVAGQPGGGLIYCGMKGAYLGVAIDNIGNFSQGHCGVGAFNQPGPMKGTAKSGIGVHGNAVAVRGPQSDNYPYITSVSLNDAQNICLHEKCTERSQVSLAAVRKVVLDMVPRVPASSGYVLNMTVNGKEVLKSVDFPYAPPAELTMGFGAATGSWGGNHEIRNVKLSVEGKVTPVNCPNGAGPNGRCLPIDNPLQHWDVFANVGNGIYVGEAPPELVDGDLAQTGWNGATPWAQTAPTLPAGTCFQVGPQARAEDGPNGPVRANQIVIVSRQDDWANAVEPTETMEFTKYGAVDLRVMYTTDFGRQWIDLTDGGIVGNNKVKRVFNLPKTELVTNVEVLICKTADNKTSPLTEILVWEKK